MVKKGRNLGRVVWPSATSGPSPRHIEKIGRNDRCPCGSGKKYKDCHEKDGSFLKRLAKEHEKEHRREVRESLKSQGVPWWKRLFLTR